MTMTPEEIEASNKKAKDVAMCKTTLEVCKKTMAILEITVVQGRQAQDLANSLMWLANVRQGLEAQLKEIEK